ncbi:MAG: ISAs1 family transposase [Chloroflexi bacterium]|nr:ISAs1 family transposase [Chloroflexota bacterium]
MSYYSVAILDQRETSPSCGRRPAALYVYGRILAQPITPFTINDFGLTITAVSITIYHSNGRFFIRNRQIGSKSQGCSVLKDIAIKPLCRKVELFFYPLLTAFLEWSLVKVVIKITRYRRVFDTKTKTWKESDEVSFYISTIALSAQTFCRAIRNHWGIENRDHHVRDVTMGEDKSRIRINPHIFAKLRSFALNILRKNNVKNVSAELYDNCMNLENVLNYVGIL